MLNVYRFDRGGSQIYRRRLPLPFPCSVHDFSLSPNYAIFYLSPYVLDLAAVRCWIHVFDALAVAQGA